MKPYEQIAFQYSHHRVDLNKDGSYKVTHAGQFINSITHYEEDKVKYAGDRDMVDLAEVVLKYYFHPIMKGRYSIKVVLPSV